MTGSASSVQSVRRIVEQASLTAIVGPFVNIAVYRPLLGLHAVAGDVSKTMSKIAPAHAKY